MGMSPAEKAANPSIRMFWVGDERNDTIIAPAQKQMSAYQGQPGPMDFFSFSVPTREVWCIKDVIHMLKCDEGTDVVHVFMHIFCNESQYGTNTQVWSKQGHGAQWLKRGAEDTGNGILPPDRRLVTDVGEMEYWRYQDKQYNLYIPIPGPSKIECGLFNNNPLGSPDVAAALMFSVLKWFPGMPPG